MPLLYTVVACRNVVLARHATSIGNFAEVTEKVLSRVDETKHKKSNRRVRMKRRAQTEKQKIQKGTKREKRERDKTEPS